MNKNLSLLGSIKSQEIKRTLTFVLSSNNIEDAKILKSNINHKLPDIRFKVLHRLDQIAKLSKTPVRVNLSHSSPAYPPFSSKINDIFDVLIESEDLRIIINFEKYNIEELRTLIEDNGISHIVEINLTDAKFDRNKHPELDRNKKDVDLNSHGSSSATVYPKNLDEIYKIIEDVMVDISMYHTLIAPNLINASLEIKRSFSFMKVCYAEKQKLISENWDTTEHKGYVSLAGYYRQLDDFDYDGYIQCWEDILAEARIKYPNDFVQTQENINEQLKRHKNYKHLPIKKIVQLYNKLQPGRYILISTYNRPEKNLKRRSILTHFKGSIWRNNKVNILPFHKLKDVEKYSQWIYIFQIQK